MAGVIKVKPDPSIVTDVIAPVTINLPLVAPVSAESETITVIIPSAPAPAPAQAQPGQPEQAGPTTTPLEMSDGHINWTKSCNTRLASADDEIHFQLWLTNTRDRMHRSLIPDQETYDLRAYWLYAARPTVTRGRFPDIGKKPNHITFSTDSKWHGSLDQNGKSMLGGRWFMDKQLVWHYEPSDFTLTVHSPDDLIRHFTEHEPNAYLDIGSRVYGRARGRIAPLGVGRRPRPRRGRKARVNMHCGGRPIGRGTRPYGHYPLFVPPLIGAAALAYYASEMERARGTAEAEYWREQYERQLHAQANKDDK